MKAFCCLLLGFLCSITAVAQTISANSATGEASIQKSTPQTTSIQSGERFNYTITFQNLNRNNNLVITDVIPAGLCFVASDVRANNAFVDQNGMAVTSPNSIPNLIDTSALPTVVFNIPDTIQSGSFTITVSFCAGVTPNGFTVTNNICADYTTNNITENFCTTGGLTSTASAVNPWGRITKEPLLPAITTAAGNTFVRATNGIANYRIIVEKDPAFQGITFGMLNLANATISEIASPACAVVTLLSGPGTFNTTTNQIEITDDLLGSDPFFFVEFIVQVDYGPCGTLAEGQSLTNRVELNGTPVGQGNQTNIANDTTTVTATVNLPGPDVTSAVIKTVEARNPVAGCQVRYDLNFRNVDNRAISPFQLEDTVPTGLIPDSYEVIGSINSFSPNRTFDVFINGTLDRSFTLPDNSGARFPWNGTSGDIIRIVAQNNTLIYPGDQIIVGLYFNIDATLTPGTLVTNCADFTGVIIVDDAANVNTSNQSCIDLLIQAPVMDVCVTKNVRIADRPDPFVNSITNVVPNDEVEFQICMQNNGSLDFNGLMEDVLDPKYEFISVDNMNMPAGTTFTQTGQSLVWNTLLIPQTCDVFTYDTGCAITNTFYCATVRVRIRPQTAAGNIDNNASLIEDTGAILAVSDFAKVNVIDSAVFIIRKEVSLDGINYQTTPLTLDPNCEPLVFYRISVENIGNRDATQFQLFDELPFPNDVFYPTSVSRNSTFSFTDVTATSTDFTASFLNFMPSGSITPANFTCASTVAGDPVFVPNTSRTIRFENTAPLTNNTTFEIVLTATLPINGLVTSDIAVNSVYARNCDPTSSIIASSSITAPATVRIEKLVEAGQDVTVNFCSDDAAFGLFNFLFGADAGGTWSPPLNGTTGIFDPAVDSPGIYTYTVTATPACATDSSQVTVGVTQQGNPGQDGTVTLCATGTPVNLFTYLNGTPDNGGSWTPALPGGNGIFNPATDTAGTYTYTIPPNVACPAISASVTVTINAPANAGQDASVNLCTSDMFVNLNTLLGGTPDTGGTWSPQLPSGTSFFWPGRDSAGVYTYTVTGNAPCPDDTAQLTITLTTAPDPGTDGTLSICANAASVDLFTALNGTPQSGGTWSPALPGGNGIFNPVSDIPGTYTYTLPAINSCLPSSAQVVVDVTPAPDPGLDASIILCESNLPLDLITVLNGTPDSGGVWSPLPASGTGIFDPAIDAPGTYIYTVSRNGCMDERATLQITFNPNVVINPAMDITACDAVGANNGLTTFNLDSQEAAILGGLNPVDHNITYHISNNDALAGTNDLGTMYQNTTTTQTIYVRVENTTTGCFATTSFTITGLLLPEPQLFDQYEACLDETGAPVNPARLPVMDTTLSASLYTFRWFLENVEIPGETQPSLTARALGNYEVEVINRVNGCTNTQTTAVVPEPVLMIEATLTTTQFSNNPRIEVSIINDRGDTYWYRLDDGLWQRSNIFENPDDGIRTVYVKGPNSCGIASDTVLVLRYPRFFTPNMDGFNDFWQIENLTDVGNKLYIFDRYGKLLKQLSLESVGWDGMYNNNPMPSSDYWFLLEYTDPNTGQTAVLRSHFSLKR